MESLYKFHFLNKYLPKFKYEKESGVNFSAELDKILYLADQQELSSSKRTVCRNNGKDHKDLSRRSFNLE